MKVVGLFTSDSTFAFSYSCYHSKSNEDKDDYKLSKTFLCSLKFVFSLYSKI